VVFWGFLFSPSLSGLADTCTAAPPEYGPSHRPYAFHILPIEANGKSKRKKKKIRSFLPTSSVHSSCKSPNSTSLFLYF
jgi:hypothetical protein